MEILSKSDKDRVIDVLAKGINTYYHNPKKRGKYGNQRLNDLEFSAKLVYNSFLNDPEWTVEMSDEEEVCVHFQETQAKEIIRRDCLKAKLLLVHKILKTDWKGKRPNIKKRNGEVDDGNDTDNGDGYGSYDELVNARLVDLPTYKFRPIVYGGFVRSAFCASIAARESVLTFILICKKSPYMYHRIGKDVAQYIAKQVFFSRFDDDAWFKEKINDIDVYLDYKEEKRNYFRVALNVLEHEFENDVRHFKDDLSDMLESTPGCVYKFVSSLVFPFKREAQKGALHLTSRQVPEPPSQRHGNIDHNFHRDGERSHKAGDFFTYKVLFSSPPFEGKYNKKLWRDCLSMDVTTNIGHDLLDADVNNLKMTWENGKGFSISLRKKSHSFNFGKHGVDYSMTLESIEHNARNKWFYAIDSCKDMSPMSKNFFDTFEIQTQRWRNLEFYGWKQNPNLPTMPTDFHYMNCLKRALETPTILYKLVRPYYEKKNEKDKEREDYYKLKKANGEDPNDGLVRVNRRFTKYDNFHKLALDAKFKSKSQPLSKEQLVEYMLGTKKKKKKKHVQQVVEPKKLTEPKKVVVQKKKEEWTVVKKGKRK